MGIKLSSLIPKKEISWEDLENKKIAVDASQMLYQFLSSIRQQDGTSLMNSKGKITSHLMGLSTRIPNLIQKKIQLIFVFDGKPPLLKINERENREHRKQIAEKRLLRAKEEEDVDAMYKYSKQTARLNLDIINESKEFLDALGLPIIQAPSEAEAQAAFIAEKKDVWAVASSDYDSLIYSTPRLIQNLTLSTRRRLPSGTHINIQPEIIILKDALKHLGINKDQLLALSILVGTDYNVGGVKRIGPKTALKLVKQYKSFDKIFKEVEADFNWKEIYAVFKSMPIMKNYKIKWGPVDKEKIRKILIDKNDFSEERVDKLINNLERVSAKKSQKSLIDF